MDNFYKIPEEMAEKIRRESEELSKKFRSRMQEYDAYSNFVESQKKGFQDDINIVLQLITRLIMEGKLYIHTKLIARIKAPESAFHNDDISKMDKNVLMGAILDKIDEKDYELKELEKAQKNKGCCRTLDDVFGMTVITDTKEELKVLKEELEKIFVFHDVREKKKEGYQATHIELFNDEKDEVSPLVECQLKTMQNHINSYDHTFYKVETNIGRILREAGKIDDKKRVKLNNAGIEKVEGIIQEYYEDGKFSIYSNIPRMWEATFNEEREEMELKALTEAQTLKRVYPSIVIRSDKIK